jgi:hypothetical protein
MPRVGSRANVAVLTDGEWWHCGSNGMGYSLDAWLAVGPEPARALFASRPERETARIIRCRHTD